MPSLVAQSHLASPLQCCASLLVKLDGVLIPSPLPQRPTTSLSVANSAFLNSSDFDLSTRLEIGRALSSSLGVGHLNNIKLKDHGIDRRRQLDTVKMTTMVRAIFTLHIHNYTSRKDATSSLQDPRWP